MYRWFSQVAEDLLVTAGLGFVVYASFLWHPVAGFYTLGFGFLTAGILLAIRGSGGRVR